jgi:hypothetical protein
MQRFTVPAFRFKLLPDAPAAFDASDPVQVTERLKSAVGKWSRGMTMGYKARAKIEFNAPLLSSLVDVVRQRGDRVSICQDHKSAFVAQTGQPAPSLGYFYALAVFEAGRLVDHWAYDNGPAPEATDESGQPRDGLYCRLGEITPLGFDMNQGLACYSGLSPTFETNAEVESGEKVPIFLIDFAATSAGYQGGCALNFHLLSAPEAPGVTTMAGAPMKHIFETDSLDPSGTICGKCGHKKDDLAAHYPPLMSATPGAGTGEGAKSMNAQIMQKLGLAATATDADKQAAIKAFAAAAPTKMALMGSEDCARMGADLDAFAEFAPDEDRESMRAMAKKFKKLGATDAAPAADPAALAAAPAPAVMAHVEPDGDEKDAEKEVMAATLKAAMSRLATLEAAEKVRTDAADAERNARVEALADAAVKGGYDKDARAALVTFARANFDGAHAAVKHLLPRETGAPAHLFARVTSQGSPLGGPTAQSARNEGFGASPAIFRTTKNGDEIVEKDGVLAAKAREMRDSKDPVIMSRVDGHAKQKYGSVDAYSRISAAQELAETDHPHLAPRNAVAG